MGEAAAFYTLVHNGLVEELGDPQNRPTCKEKTKIPAPVGTRITALQPAISD